MKTKSSKACDRASLLHSRWQRARHVSLLLCRVQQRLESRMMVNTGIPVLTGREPVSRLQRLEALHQQGATAGEAYLVACEAEVFAMTEALKLQDAIPEVAAISLAGVVAKLEMIVGADRDIGDPTDFPWPHIASVLRDLKAVAGELPPYRPDRAATRAEVAKHWEAAAKLVAAVKGEDACGHRTLAV